MPSIPIDFPLIVLAFMAAWIAASYAKAAVGPDEALWLAWPFVGMRPLRDYSGGFIGISVLMRALGWLTNNSLYWMKLLFFCLVGSTGGVVYLLTGSFAAGLFANTVLLSGCLMAFQSWYDTAWAALFLLGILPGVPGPLRLALLGAAVLVNHKAAPSVAVWLLASRHFGLLGVGAASVAVGLAALRLASREWFDILWDQMVTFTLNARSVRGKTRWSPWLQQSLVVGVPALLIGLWSRPDLPLLAALLVYLWVNGMGKAWRPNHLLPLAMLAAAGPPLYLVVGLAILDWAYSSLYLQDPWDVDYTTFAPAVWDAREAGELLRNLPGKLYVDGTAAGQVYIYARKPCYTGIIDQMECRDAEPERQKRELFLLRTDPPEWVVRSNHSGLISPQDLTFWQMYRQTHTTQGKYFTVFRRK